MAFLETSGSEFSETRRGLDGSVIICSRAILCFANECTLPSFWTLFRLRRSQSTTFNPDDMPETEFKRGGTRATAGPRLGWSRDLGQTNK